jgi:predicted amidophosphoribosyltransferase
MPKCKKCGQNMPKSFSHCGCCGADMATGLVPTPTKIFDTPTKEETTTTPVAETSTPKDISGEMRKKYYA